MPDKKRPYCKVYLHLLGVDIPGTDRKTAYAHVIVFGIILSLHSSPKGCVASAKKIAEMAKIKKWWMREVLKDLEQMGWVAIQRRPNGYVKRIIPNDKIL